MEFDFEGDWELLGKCGEVVGDDMRIVVSGKILDEEEDGIVSLLLESIDLEIDIIVDVV